MHARQSTAKTFMIGPVLDSSGVAVTDCVVGDFKLSKNGATPAALNGSSTLTHRHTGHYSLASAAGDFDTVGAAQFVIDDATNACQPVSFDVVEEAVYDRDYAASATGYIANQPVDVNTIKTQSVTCGAGVTVLASVGTAATSTAQTGDVYAIANSGTHGNAALKTLIDAKASQVSVDTIDDFVDTEIATLVSNVATVLAAVDTEVGVILGRVDVAVSTRSAAGDAMTLTSGERTAVANEVEAQIIDDTDSEKVLTAITDKIASVNPSLDDLTLASIASAIRTELATELARLDAAVSTRATPAQVNTEADTALADVGVTTTVTGRIDAAVSSRLASAGYTAPPTAAANRIEMDSNSTQLAAIAADASELQADWVNGGRLDLILDARASQTSVDDLPTDLVDAMTGDSITPAKANELLAAFVLGKVSASSSGGITTYTYKRRDGSTTSFTSVCSESDGTRASTGSIP